nr:MAG TPA: hypothetical protein [Caudoviricetes sp.]
MTRLPITSHPFTKNFSSAIDKAKFVKYISYINFSNFTYIIASM